jgi:hypothetical protein
MKYNKLVLSRTGDNNESYAGSSSKAIRSSLGGLGSD